MKTETRIEELNVRVETARAAYNDTEADTAAATGAAQKKLAEIPKSSYLYEGDAPIYKMGKRAMVKELADSRITELGITGKLAKNADVQTLREHVERLRDQRHSERISQVRVGEFVDANYEAQRLAKQRADNSRGILSIITAHAVIDSLRLEHRWAVMDMIKRGKPVSESVLADYPDLKPARARAADAAALRNR